MNIGRRIVWAATDKQFRSTEAIARRVGTTTPEEKGRVGSILNQLAKPRRTLRMQLERGLDDYGTRVWHRAANAVEPEAEK